MARNYFVFVSLNDVVCPTLCPAVWMAIRKVLLSAYFTVTVAMQMILGFSEIPILF